MSNHRYNTPEEGELDWHIPLNENFRRLDRDVEIRDAEANLDSYDPEPGTKFLATDTGATYTGDGTSWNLVGYVTRAGGGDIGHFVNYEDGLDDEVINTILFDSEEVLEVVRLSFPVKGTSETVSDLRLRVYEGAPDGEPMVEVQGNELKRAAADDSAPWTATSGPVTVAITNATGGAVDVVPKVWTNIRQE